VLVVARPASWAPGVRPATWGDTGVLGSGARPTSCGRDRHPVSWALERDAAGGGVGRDPSGCRGRCGEGSRWAVAAGVGRGAARLPRSVELWGGESPVCHGRRGEGSRRVAAAGGGVGRGVAGLSRPAWGVDPPSCRDRWRRGEGVVGLPRSAWGVEPPSCRDRHGEGSHARRGEAAANPSFGCAS
jgi:hypothetical protein